MAARAVEVEHVGADHGVGQAVRDAVLPAERVRHAVHVPHVGLGEGRTGTEGGVQHALARLDVAPVVVGALEEGADEAHGVLGVGARLLGGGAADVGLDRVHERVDARGARDLPGQAERGAVVEHRHARDERKVVDGVLVVGLAVGDDGGQRGLRAGARRGGHRHEQGQALAHTQDAAHLGDGLVGLGDTRAGRLGAVHRGAAAKGDERIATLFEIERPGRLDVVDRGVCHRFVEHRVGDAVGGKRFLEVVDEAQGVDHLVGHDERMLGTLALEQAGHLVDRLEDLGLPVGQKRQREPQNGLEGATVRLAQRVHGRVLSLCGAGYELGHGVGLERADPGRTPAVKPRRIPLRNLARNLRETLARFFEKFRASVSRKLFND